MCSDAPDTSRQDAVAERMSKMSEEQLAWAKQIYAETAPDRADAKQRANEVSDVQLEAMKKQTELTDDYSDYNKSTFRPLEQEIAKEAGEYDTAERRASASADAVAGVEQQVAAQQDIANRNLERKGINPGSGKTLALAGALGLGAAKLKAGAASSAVKQIETIGAAKKMDAVGLGRGLAANQATSASLALNQGNSSSAGLASLGAITAQGNAMMTSGFSGAQAGLSGAGGIYQNSANLKAQAGDNSAIWGTLGAVGGAFVGSPAGGAAIGKMIS